MSARSAGSVKKRSGGSEMARALFETSGDVLTDRRFEMARQLHARGDAFAAADLLQQVVERAPGFAAAWFLLGQVRLAMDHGAGAIEAFRAARREDPDDRHGAALWLARLDAAPIFGAMSPAYVRTLFDQYASRFDTALVDNLAYRGPELMRDAIRHVCAQRDRAPHFARVLDLGCGTGLAGAALRPLAGHLVGIELSERMIELARARGVYDDLEIGELRAFLERPHEAPYDLIVAVDVLVYIADLEPVISAAARILDRSGLFAFTIESRAGGDHAADDQIGDVELTGHLRYAHGESHVRGAILRAGLSAVGFERVSTRMEGGAAVPGFLVITGHP